MTLGKKIGLGALAVLLILLAAPFAVVAFYDWNGLKPQIEERASATLGREVAISGDLDIGWQWPSGDSGWRRWVPWLQLHAERLRIGSPAALTDTDLVNAEALSISFAPLPLLDRRLSLPAITLRGAQASLVRVEDGNNNWTFDLTGEDNVTKEEGAGNEDSQSGWTVDVGTLDFDPIDIDYRDATLAADINASLELLGEPIAFDELTDRQGVEAVADQPVVDYRFGWQVEGTYQHQPVTGSGRLGGLAALRSPGAPYPLQASLEAGGTQVDISGTLTDPLSPKQLNLDLGLSGRSLGDLYDILGVTLPETPAYATRGHLTANLDTQEALVFTYDDFDGEIGESDIHGHLTYRMGEPRPSLTGEVISNQLRFADLAPLIGADSNETTSPSNEETQDESRTQPADKLLPVSEFQTAQWRTMDADVTFTAERIEHGNSLPLEDLYTHVTLNDGEILLDPLRFGVAGGDLNTTLRLDGSQTPMQSRVDMHIRRLRLGQLFPDVDMMDESQGELNGDATLSGSGNSVASVLGSSNGNLQMLISDGRISQNLMELAGLNVGNYLIGQLFGDEQVDIHCAATHLEVEKGIARTRFFVIDTENALVRISGTVNLGDETLDLTVEPESKGARIFTLRSPLYVRGTFKNPSPGVDTGSLLTRGAVGAFLGTVAAPAAGLLALVSPSTDETTPCNDFLSQLETE
ncbi:AsmA family protein [Salinicola avicenniae]|uniref:AsmA family protein n=1 Tax=Salinicola avicenniae TaxID=2916836 RepID=UPI0020749484|nr:MULTISPECIES: AsmA family protein [unclassified Salinicola]